jgi:hypothetical protein
MPEFTDNLRTTFVSCLSLQTIFGQHFSCPKIVCKLRHETLSNKVCFVLYFINNYIYIYIYIKKGCPFANLNSTKTCDIKLTTMSEILSIRQRSQFRSCVYGSLSLYAIFLQHSSSVICFALICIHFS